MTFTGCQYLYQLNYVSILRMDRATGMYCTLGVYFIMHWSKTMFGANKTTFGAYKTTFGANKTTFGAYKTTSRGNKTTFEAYKTTFGAYTTTFGAKFKK